MLNVGAVRFPAEPGGADAMTRVPAVDTGAVRPRAGSTDRLAELFLNHR